MTAKVRVKTGKTNVQLPNGLPADAGAVAYLTDEQYAQLQGTGILGTFLDDLTTEVAPAPVGLPGLVAHFTPVIALSSIANGNLSTTWTPGFAGTIVAVSAIVSTVATTASKLSTLTWKIGSTATTGGAVALTSANCTPLYNRVTGTQVTAANVFTATDVLTLSAASTTAFVEGAVLIQTLVLKS